MRSILFLLFINLMTACNSDDESCNATINIKNETENTIWLAFEEKESTTVTCESNIFTRIDAGNTFEFLVIGAGTNECWEDDLQDLFNGALVIYLFEEEPQLTLVNDCDQEILEGQVVNRREFTLEDLKAMDWRVVYP